MGRTYQLQKTYIQNIEDNLPYGDVNFVLLNYNSQDGMDEWVNESLSDYIKKGLLNI